MGERSSGKSEAVQTELLIPKLELLSQNKRLGQHSVISGKDLKQE